MNSNDKNLKSAGKDVSGSVHGITEASRDLFQAGERIASNLDQLEKRVERATDWRAQLADHPWATVLGGILAGFFIAKVVRG